MSMKNEKIAKVLGFKKSTYKVNGREVEFWIYPDDYKHLQVGVPEHTIPDFEGILDDALKFIIANHLRRA